MASDVPPASEIGNVRLAKASATIEAVALNTSKVSEATGAPSRAVDQETEFAATEVT